MRTGIMCPQDMLPVTNTDTDRYLRLSTTTTPTSLAIAIIHGVFADVLVWKFKSYKLNE